MGLAWKCWQLNDTNNNTEFLVSGNDNGKAGATGNPLPDENDNAPPPAQGDAASNDIPSNGNIITNILTVIY